MRKQYKDYDTAEGCKFCLYGRLIANINEFPFWICYANKNMIDSEHCKSFKYDLQEINRLEQLGLNII